MGELSSQNAADLTEEENPGLSYDLTGSDRRQRRQTVVASDRGPSLLRFLGRDMDVDQKRERERESERDLGGIALRPCLVGTSPLPPVSHLPVVER